uniref:ShKT domain-containing protein n=1 Tax=Caulobacter sp. (strain K31) TaxID=366602 RepID=B0T880_CAUSK
MRRALACLLLIATVAGPAVAQTAKPTRVVPSKPSSAPAQGASPALPPPLIPLTGASQGRDPDQCRAGCARTYYFCRANGDDDSCSTQWMQCKSRCTATYSPR